MGISLIELAVSNPAAQLTNLWTSPQFPWEVIAVLAIGITFLFSAIAYMFGRLFSSKDIQKFAKVELMYALSTVILVAFLIFMIDVMAVKATAFVISLSRDKPALLEVVQGSPSPFTVAEFYLNRTSMCAQTRYVETFCMAAIPMTISSVDTTTDVGITSPGWLTTASGKVTGAGVKNLVSVFNNFLGGTIYNLMYVNYLLYIQKHLLLFAQQTMLLIFLPLGVILRAFPVVRGTGNLMISVALGLYFVYPLTYGILLVMSRPIDNLDTSCGIAGISNAEYGTWWSTTLRTLPCGDLVDDARRMAGSTISRMFAESNVLVGSYTAILTEFQHLISEMIIYAVVYPFVVAVVTYTFIKSFATFLNVEAQEFAEGLIKMV